jgi:hypothetical protein
MIRKSIPANETFARWRKDPAYAAAYDALEEEFALAESFIKTRANAEMTWEERPRSGPHNWLSRGSRVCGPDHPFALRDDSPTPPINLAKTTVRPRRALVQRPVVR